MQHITGVSFINDEIAKADFDPLVAQFDGIDHQNLEQTIARAHKAIKELKRKSGGHRTVRPVRPLWLPLRSENLGRFDSRLLL